MSFIAKYFNFDCKFSFENKNCLFISDNIYNVTVYTGDIKGAGTNASVFITLFGEFTDSGKHRLRSSIKDFQRGRWVTETMFIINKWLANAENNTIFYLKYVKQNNLKTNYFHISCF